MSSIIVCGNGPSLSEVDLSSLVGVTTLGMNAAYRYWEKIDWYPDIYCCLDDRVVVSHQDQILSLLHEKKCKIFFLHPNILSKYPGMAAYPNVFFSPSFDILYSQNMSIRAALGLPMLDAKMFWSRTSPKVTTGAYSVRFAAALGFKKILLLGIDARYVEIIEGAQEVAGIGLSLEKTPTHNPNYFFADYQQAGDQYNLPTPPSHDGNLHSDVFQYIRDDFKIVAPDVKISIGSKKSELFSQKTFKYKDLDEFLGEAEALRYELNPAELRGRKSQDIPFTSIRGAVFASGYFSNGVQRTGLTEVTFSPDATKDSAATLILGVRQPFKPGSTLVFTADLRADKNCDIAISVARHGNFGPYEEAVQRIRLKAKETTRIEAPITLKHAQTLIRLQWAPVEGAPIVLSVTGLQATQREDNQWVVGETMQGTAIGGQTSAR